MSNGRKGEKDDQSFRCVGYIAHGLSTAAILISKLNAVMPVTLYTTTKYDFTEGFFSFKWKRGK